MTKIKDIENLQSQITQNLENIVDNVSSSINNLQCNINGLENNINEKLETDNLVKSLNIIPVNDEWTQLGQTVEGKLERDYVGISALSADGNIYVTNFRNYNNENDELPYVQSYKYNGFSWIPFGNKIYDDTNDGYLYKVDLARDGKILAISDIDNDGDSSDPNFNSGRVKVFKYNNEKDEWKQIGQNLDGLGRNAYLSYSVSLSTNGNILSINSPDAYNNKGQIVGKTSVYSFDEDQNLWIPFGQELYGNGLDFFGYSSSLSGDGKILSVVTLLEFTLENNDINSISNGYIQTFKYDDNDNEWKPLGQKILAKNYNTLTFDNVKLSIDGKTLSVGSWQFENFLSEDQKTNNKLVGLVFKYDENNKTWYQ